jgi:hypothetical protein
MYAPGEAEDRDVRDGREAHAVLEDVRELDRAVEVDGAREGHAELLDDHADERHHGDAAVLDLDGAAAREALLVLPERARRLDRPGVDADVGRRVDGRAGRGAAAAAEVEGGGRGGEEGESELGHFNICGGREFLRRPRRRKASRR